MWMCMYAQRCNWSTRCGTLQHTATHCNTFSLIRAYKSRCACRCACTPKMKVSTYCNTVQHTATHYNAFSLIRAYKSRCAYGRACMPKMKCEYRFECARACVHIQCVAACCSVLQLRMPEMKIECRFGCLYSCVCDVGVRVRRKNMCAPHASDSESLCLVRVRGMLMATHAVCCSAVQCVAVCQIAVCCCVL